MAKTHRTEENMLPYELAATNAAEQLRRRGFAEIIMYPGDATGYRFMVLAAGRGVDCVREDGRVTIDHSRNYVVTVASPDFGRTYEWVGDPLYWDYVADKWTMKYNGNADEWTGRVLCLFLNCLAELVPGVTG